MAKINVGCGWECRDGWLNVDNTQKWQKVNYPITFMDATVVWPYEDNKFTAALSEHMIEHIPRASGRVFFKEMFRTLKPGKTARVTCPNRTFFETLRDNAHPFVINYCKEILNGAIPSAQRVKERTLNDQGHVWVPTPEQLIAAFEEAGFIDVKVVPYGQSKHKVFDGIEEFNGIREHETLCVEGTKPK